MLTTHHGSKWIGNSLSDNVIRHVEEPNMSLQSSFVSTVHAIGAVEQDAVLKVISVNIAKVILVR